MKLMKLERLSVTIEMGRRLKLHAVVFSFCLHGPKFVVKTAKIAVDLHVCAPKLMFSTSTFGKMAKKLTWD